MSFFGSFSSSSSGGHSGTPPHDIRSQSGLTSLYNQNVVRAEHVERPIPGAFGIKHSGVRVTTNDGNQYLVHKGSGYGVSSETVVTNARHMSNNWKAVGAKDVSGVKVADYVKAGGKDYNLAFDNCHDGRKRGMKLGD